MSLALKIARLAPVQKDNVFHADLCFNSSEGNECFNKSVVFDGY